MFGRFKRDRVPQTAGVPRWPLEAWRRKDLRADAPEYVAVCLTPAFPEEEESRILDKDALRRLVGVAGTHGSTSPEMAELVRELLAEERYAGLGSLYSWLAPVYRGTDRELEVIGEGLRECRRKHGVLDLAGSAMLRRGRAADALYYWAQSVTNAESIGEADDASAYDFLRVAAHAMGERAAAFGARADEQRIELDDEATALVERVFRKPTAPMRTVVRTLAREASA